MKRSEQIAYCMGKLNCTDSLLSGLIGVTQQTLHDEESQKSEGRLSRLVKFLQMCEAAGFQGSGWYWNALDEPLNASSLSEDDQDCTSCASHYVHIDTYPEAEMIVAFSAAIEIFKREIKIQELNDLLHYAMGED